jgi:hypothetical protein
VIVCASYSLGHFLADQRGATAIEYGLKAALIAVATMSVVFTTCPSRKLNPRVAMMQPRQNCHGDNGSASLDRATERSILIQ